MTPATAPASVTCAIHVNGVLRLSVTFSGTGTVADWQTVGLVADPDTDVVELCTSVTAGGHTTGPDCVDATAVGPFLFA